MYTPTEVNKLVGILEDLIEDVESLSSQLQKAERVNKALLKHQNEMYDLIHKDKKIMVH